MYDKEQLTKMAGDAMAIWAYDAGGLANLARNQLGFFPADGEIKSGDIVYIRGGGTVTHHYVTLNPYEGKLSLSSV